MQNLETFYDTQKFASSRGYLKSFQKYKILLALIWTDVHGDFRNPPYTKTMKKLEFLIEFTHIYFRLYRHEDIHFNELA